MLLPHGLGLFDSWISWAPLCLCWLSIFELSFPFWFLFSFSGFFFPSSFFVSVCVCVLPVWWWWRWWWWWGKLDKSKTKTEQKLNKLQILVQTLWLTLSESGRVVKLDEKFWLPEMLPNEIRVSTGTDGICRTSSSSSSSNAVVVRTGQTGDEFTLTYLGLGKYLGGRFA